MVRRTLRRRLVLSTLESRVTPTAFNWVGTAGDGQWTNATNWSPNGLPGAADDVTIAGSPSVYYQNGGTATIKSLNQTGYLQINNTNLTVTNGLTANSTSQIELYSAANFSVSGATSVDGTTISTHSASTMTCNNLTSVTGPVVWRAYDANSKLQFPALTTINLTNSFGYFDSYSGGLVSIPNVNKLDTGNVEMQANDPTGVVDFSGLKTLSFPAGYYGSLNTQYGGQIKVNAALTSLDEVNLSIGSSTSFPAAQLTSLTNSTVDTYGATTSVSFSGLTALSGSTSADLYFRAHDGSKLSFPNVTTFTANENAFTHIQAFGGSTVSIPGLSKIDTGFLELYTQDAGSVIDLSGVKSLAYPDYTYGILNTQNGGQIKLNAAFTTIDRTSMYIGSSTAIPTSQITAITNSSVYTYGSGTVANFSGVTSLSGISSSDVYFQASDGSSLLFPNATSIIANQSAFTRFRAFGGSTVSIPNVSKVDTGYVELLSWDAGSLVDASGLKSLSFPGNSYGELNTQYPGQINVNAALTKLDRVNLRLGSSTSFNTAQLTDLTHSTLYVYAGTPNLNNITNVTGSDFYVYNAGTVASLPGVVSITDDSSYDIYYQAESGGKLQFPNVTSIDINTSAFTRFRAFGGSTVSIPNVSKFDGGYVELLSWDSGSLVDASSLATLTFPPNTYGEINTQYVGQIKVSPSLTKISHVNLRIGDATSFPVGQITDLTASTLYVYASVDFTNLVNIAGSSIYANNAGTVAKMTGVVSIPASPNYDLYFEADGGSTLSFPNLTSVTANTSAFTRFRAFGSTVNLPLVAKINTGYIEILAAGGAVNAASLATLTAPAGTYGSLNVQFGGTVTVAPGLTAIDRFNVYLDSNTAFPTGQLTALTNSGLNVYDGAPDFSKITNFDGSSVDANGTGAKITMSGVVTMAAATNGDSYFEADNGGTVDFPNMTKLIGTNSATIRIRTYYGSGDTVSMAKLTKIDTGYFDVYAQNTGNVVNLPSLTTLAPPTGANGYIYVNYSGQLNTAASLELSNSYMYFDDTAKLNFTSLKIDAGTTVDGFGKLAASITNGGVLRLVPGGPGTLELTGNYTQTSAGELQIDLGGLTKSTQYDYLKVDGSATLDGALSINLISGYQPMLGDTQTPLTATSVTGNFVNYYGLDVGNNVQLFPQYSATDLTLKTIPASGPFVTGLAPSGNVFNSVSFIDVTFDESIDGNSLQTADATVTGPGGPYTPTSIALIASNVVRVSLPTLSAQGKYTVTVGPHITNMAGNEMNQNGNAVNGEIPGDQFVGSFSIVTADLVVDSFGMLPANANFGQTINVPYTVRNDGSAATAGGWYDYVYLSTDTVFDGSDEYLGNVPSPALPINPGQKYMSTATVTLPLAPVHADGNYYLIVVANASGGLTESNTGNNTLTSPAIPLKTPPRVVMVDVNGGAAQRSRVTSATVTFNEVVNLPANVADAFVVTQIGGGGNVALTGSASTVMGHTVVTLNFQPGTLFVNGSLVDGRYQLKVLASKVTDATSLNLDGNADGITGDDYVNNSSGTSGIFRLFGDADGNAVVNSTDFLAFRASFGGNNTIFDFNNNGTVDAADFLAFRSRFGSSV